MDCRDVREMADSFLAEELLTETNHEILRHLETCPACRADLAARRSLREGMRQAFQRSRELDPTPEFVTRLRGSLMQRAHHASARRGIRVPAWWALAASVLLVVALGLGYRGRDWLTATAALARTAVGDHRNCALQFRLDERPISLEEAAQRYGAAYRVLATLPPDDVRTAVGPAHVIERHSCVYGGRRFAHIVFEYRGEKVSLLVAAAERDFHLILPGAALPHVTSAGRIDDVPVMSFRAGGHMVFLIGDVKEADLMTLASAIAAPLYRELSGV